MLLPPPAELATVGTYPMSLLLPSFERTFLEDEGCIFRFRAAGGGEVSVESESELAEIVDLDCVRLEYLERLERCE